MVGLWHSWLHFRIGIPVAPVTTKALSCNPHTTSCFQEGLFNRSGLCMHVHVPLNIGLVLLRTGPN